METTITSREQRRAWVLSRVLKDELTMTEAADLVKAAASPSMIGLVAVTLRAAHKQ